MSIKDLKEMQSIIDSLKGAFEDMSKASGKFYSNIQQSNKLLESFSTINTSIKETQKEISKTNNEQLSNISNENEQQIKKSEELEKQNKEISSILINKKELRKIDRSIERSLNNQLSSNNDNLKVLDETRSKIEESTSINEKNNSINKIGLDSLEREYVKLKTSLSFKEKSLSIAKEDYQVGKISLTQLTQQSEEFQKQSITTKNRIKALEEMQEIYVHNSEVIDDITRNDFKLIDIQKEKTNILNLEFKLKEAIKAKNKEDEEYILSQLQIEKDKIETQEEYNKKINVMSSNMEKASSVLDGLVGNTTGLIQSLPGGNFLSEKLGINEFGEKFKSNVLQNMQNGFLQGKTSGTSMFKGLIGGVKGFGAALMTGPQAIIIGIIAGVALLVKMFMDVDAHVKEVSSSMEVGRLEALKMTSQAQELASDMHMVGINTGEVIKTMGELRESMGGVRLNLDDKDQKQMLETATVLGEKFNVSAEETVRLNRIASSMNVSLEQLTTEAAAFGKETIGSEKALKALAELPVEMTMHYKGTSAELARATIQGKMFGLTLEKANQIGDQMLDIESSLGAEMEARLMTGREINLDKIREMQLNGDVVGVQQEIMNQLSDIKDFNELNPLQAESLAKAYGMSTDELSNMISKKNELEQLGLTAERMAELEAKSAEELYEIAKEGGNEVYQQKLKDMALEKEKASAANTFADLLTKIKEHAMKIVIPIMEVIDGLFSAKKVGEDTKDVVGGIGSVFGMIGSIIKPIVTTLGVLFKIAWNILSAVLNPIFSIMGQIGDSVSKVFGLFSDGKGEVMELSDIIGYVGKVIEFGIMMTLRPILGMLNLFEGIWISIGQIIDGDIEGALKTMGDTILKIVLYPIQLIDDIFGTNIMDSIGDVGKLFNWVGSQIDTYFLQPLGVVGDAIKAYVMWPINLVMDIFSGIYQMLTGDFMGGLETIGEGLKNYFLAPFELVWDLISGIGGLMDVVVDGLSNLIPEWLKSGIEWLLGGESDTKVETDIPQAAIGGEVQKQGTVLVGEQGPELVILPEGANIIPNAETVGLLQDMTSMEDPQISIGSAQIQGGESLTKAQISSPTSTSQSSDGGGNKMDEIIRVLNQLVDVASKPANVYLGDKLVGEIDSSIGLRREGRSRFDKDYSGGN